MGFKQERQSAEGTESLHFNTQTHSFCIHAHTHQHKFNHECKCIHHKKLSLCAQLRKSEREGVFLKSKMQIYMQANHSKSQGHKTSCVHPHVLLIQPRSKATHREKLPKDNCFFWGSRHLLFSRPFIQKT